MHIVIQIPDRRAYLAFIRTVTAQFVEFLSKRAGSSLKGIFDLRPYARVLSWGRQFHCVREYSKLNDQEARGLIKRKKPNKPVRGRPKKSKN
jgi:hypothetical protein